MSHPHHSVTTARRLSDYCPTTVRRLSDYCPTKVLEDVHTRHRLCLAGSLVVTDNCLRGTVFEVRSPYAHSPYSYSPYKHSSMRPPCFSTRSPSNAPRPFPDSCAAALPGCTRRHNPRPQRAATPYRHTTRMHTPRMHAPPPFVVARAQVRPLFQPRPMGTFELRCMGNVEHLSSALGPVFLGWGGE